MNVSIKELFRQLFFFLKFNIKHTAEIICYIREKHWVFFKLNLKKEGKERIKENEKKKLLNSIVQ